IETGVIIELCCYIDLSRGKRTVNRKIPFYAAINAALLLVGGCKALPVSEIPSNGGATTYVALGDDAEEALENANKFCRRTGHQIAVVDRTPSGKNGEVAVSNGNGGFRLRAGADGSADQVYFN